MQFLPAPLRRRLSRLSKMALKVAYDCVPDIDSIHSVFCSRHGDIKRSLTLLQDITAANLVSPTGFSMSVHNTASGLFSIARHDTAFSTATATATAIASAQATFATAFMDAAALLISQRVEHVLLVVSDEPIPPPFDTYQDETQLAYAAAFLLSLRGAGKGVSLTIKPQQNEVSWPEPHGLAFLRFFLREQDELLIPDQRVSWQWQRLCCKN